MPTHDGVAAGRRVSSGRAIMDSRGIWHGGHHRRKARADQRAHFCRLRVERLEHRTVPDTTPAPMLDPNENANHNGGVMRFGPDGKLYLFMGDQGRRGWLQNLPNGPFLTAPQQDDTFGGPAPDNAHFTGVIVRLNDDGTTPSDNPFFA